MDDIQGDYVALASEPLCICGVDVSAPQQFRGQRKVTLDEMLHNIGSVFTQNEVCCQTCSACELVMVRRLPEGYQNL